jgi:hypothetical protein
MSVCFSERWHTVRHTVSMSVCFSERWHTVRHTVSIPVCLNVCILSDTLSPCQYVSPNVGILSNRWYIDCQTYFLHVSIFIRSYGVLSNSWHTDCHKYCLHVYVFLWNVCIFGAKAQIIIIIITALKIADLTECSLFSWSKQTTSYLLRCYSRDRGISTRFLVQRCTPTVTTGNRTVRSSCLFPAVPAPSDRSRVKLHRPPDSVALENLRPNTCHRSET